MSKHHRPPAQGFDNGNGLDPSLRLRMELQDAREHVVALQQALQNEQAMRGEHTVLLLCALAKMPRVEGATIDDAHLEITNADIQAAQFSKMRIIPGEAVKRVYLVRTGEELAAANAKWEAFVKEQQEKAAAQEKPSGLVIA